MKYLIYFVFFTLTIIIVSCAVKINDIKQNVNHYNISLNLDPEKNFLEIKGSFNYVSVGPFCDSVIFYLHKQFRIKSVSGLDVENYKFYSSSDTSLITNPDARILFVKLSKPIKKGESTVINFEYSGQISQRHNLSQNIISKDWTEISSNLPWFPYNIKHGEFNFNLSVDCSDEYKVRSAGLVSVEKNVFKSLKPINEIIVIASKTIYEINTSNSDYDLNLYYTDIADSTANKLNEDVKWILNNLGNRFGNSEKKNYSVFQTLRDVGGSYSSLGMITLSQFYDSTYNEDYLKRFKQLSHSAAKLWWGNAEHNWNDWMNEGFAEFSALLLIKQKFGNEIFSKVLKEKEDSILGLPPIWNFNREYLFEKEQFLTANRIMNYKAPVFLWQLYNLIGDSKFFALSREIVSNKIGATEGFLLLLSKREGKEIADWFEKKLKEV